VRQQVSSVDAVLYCANSCRVDCGVRRLGSGWRDHDVQQPYLRVEGRAWVRRMATQAMELNPACFPAPQAFRWAMVNRFKASAPGQPQPLLTRSDSHWSSQTHLAYLLVFNHGLFMCAQNVIGCTPQACFTKASCHSMSIAWYLSQRRHSHSVFGIFGIFGIFMVRDHSLQAPLHGEGAQGRRTDAGEARRDMENKLMGAGLAR